MTDKLKLKTLLFWVALLLCSCAKAPGKKDSSVTAPKKTEATITEEPAGFYLPTDSKLPTTVAEATNSVFVVAAPIAAYAQDLEDAQTLRAKLLASDVPTILKKASLRQIEICEKKRGLTGFVGKRCRVSFRYEIGSAFLMGDGNTLWSALHVFSGSLGGREAADGAVAQGTWPIFVFDAASNLVIDPMNDTLQIAHLAPSGQNTMTNPFLAWGTLGSDDYIAITLSKSLGRPLPRASTAPNFSETVYLVGYPSCTGCPGAKTNHSDYSDRSPFPNAGHFDLRISFGHRVSYVWYKSAMAQDASMEDPNLLFTNTDAVGGNSGGPLLNSRGEVIALVSTSGASLVEGRKRRAASLVVPPTK